ncbi:LamB/YcsF family protein [Bacillus sp. FJAT-22090]|uniref:LamB/YcsF family protein n=1 Tax=Bacillus sp. FJAT-22090 TaxID=1581038 RepID=UPI00119F7EB8|nr:5-oxoprolinase subunit PxpA [Bacillus sp. FJAT-22090]
MRIDLNADVGESFGNYIIGEDDALFKVITSANIACGFHAGDFTVINKTIQAAKENHLSIGAHPGYPDKQGFGRRNLNMSSTEVYEMVVYQIGALQAFCHIHHVSLSHVKPHGALYNRSAEDEEIANAIAKAVLDTAPNAILFGLCNSELLKAGASLGLKTAGEAFADRKYDDKGRLVGRGQSDALLTDFKEIMEQVENIVMKNQVVTRSGKMIDINADTLCFHGDGNNVAEIVQKTRKILEAKNVKVAPLERI